LLTATPALQTTPDNNMIYLFLIFFSIRHKLMNGEGGLYTSLCAKCRGVEQERSGDLAGSASRIRTEWKRQ
jgi:hypothetical protein